MVGWSSLAPCQQEILRVVWLPAVFRMVWCAKERLLERDEVAEAQWTCMLVTLSPVTLNHLWVATKLS